MKSVEKASSRLCLVGCLLLIGLAACGGDSSSSDDDDSGAGGGAGGIVVGSGAGAGTQVPSSGIEWLDAHNNIRRNGASPPPNPPLDDFTWDEALVASAQEWANKCVFEHSGSGENLFASTDGRTPTYVVDSWASEVQYYNYSNGDCSDVCGHYTQIVWRDTERVGCAIADCAHMDIFDGPGQFAVCHYEYPGNYIGEKPY
jgi:pathogenesis-related protein 1